MPRRHPAGSISSLSVERHPVDDRLTLRTGLGPASSSRATASCSNRTWGRTRRGRVLLSGCRRAPSSSGIIQQFGTYASPDRRLSLVIFKQEGSIVAFTLSSASDGRSLYSDRIGSDGQRWCFYWDEQRRLWAYSSDTGYFSVFTIQQDGSVRKSEVDKSTRMPKLIHEFLPNSLKHHESV